MGNFDNYYKDKNGNEHRDIPLGTSPGDAYTRTNIKLRREVERIDTAIQETHTHIDAEINRVNDVIENINDSVSEQLENAVNDINKTIGDMSISIDTQISLLTTTVNNRIDNIISHNNNSDGNSELIDIRTGGNGTVYESAGDAVRTQLNCVDSKIESLESFTNYRFELLQPAWTIGNYYHYQRAYTNANALITDENTAHVILYVYKGEKYIVRGIAYYNINPAILYNTDGSVRVAYPGEHMTDLTISQAAIEIMADGILIINAYIRPTTNGMSGYPAIYKALSIKEKDTKFSGKTVLFSGDSITNGYGWDSSTAVSNRKIICLTHPENTDYYNLGWAQTFAEDHRGTTVYGYGVNGTRISLTEGNNSITERISDMSEDADYIIFSGGINDCFNKIALGQMVSTEIGNNAWKSAQFDTSTYCGALETLFRTAYNKWPNAKIAFIITGKNTNCMKKVLYDVTQEDFVNATIQICKKWSIPYLDLYHNDGLCTALPETMSLWFANDQTHPNEKCYREKLRYLVEDFMQKL